MISAKKAKAIVVEGGRYSFTDYLSRLSWIKDQIITRSNCGQNNLDFTMKVISLPTFKKVIEKLKNKGYEIVQENYSLIVSEGHLLIKW